MLRTRLRLGELRRVKLGTEQKSLRGSRLFQHDVSVSVMNRPPGTMSSRFPS
jgi:hypothetical protein